MGMFSATIAGLDIPAATGTLEKALQPNEASSITLTLSVPPEWYACGGQTVLLLPERRPSNRCTQYLFHTTRIMRRKIVEGRLCHVEKMSFRTLAIVTDDNSKPGRIANLSGSGSLTLRYVVNGASLWIRGSNVIPLDEFAGRADPETLRLQLESAAAAGMNMLLIWGGGIYQYTVFYEAADKLGLLLSYGLMYSAQQQSSHLCTATQMQRREIVYNVRVSPVIRPLLYGLAVMKLEAVMFLQSSPNRC